MASNAITKATDAASAASTAQTAAENAQTTANLAYEKASDWKIVKFIINQSDPTCEVILGSYYRDNIESADVYHESVDASFTYGLYFKTELKAAAVVKSNVTDNTDFHDTINFNNTIIIPNHGDGSGYNNKNFNVSSMSSNGYSLDTFDGVTFAIPFQMVKNADNQDLFENFPTYSVLASTPSVISVNYVKSYGEIYETIYDNVNIIISIGIKDSEPALFYTIDLPKTTGDSSNLYLGNLRIKIL